MEHKYTHKMMTGWYFPEIRASINIGRVPGKKKIMLYTIRGEDEEVTPLAVFSCSKKVEEARVLLNRLAEGDEPQWEKK